MKVVPGIVFSFLLVVLNCQAQEDLRIMRLNKFEMKESQASGAFKEMEDTHIPALLNDRFNLMGYKPLKFEGYQIISSHQAYSNFDIVYFIDKNGHTTKKIMASTAPHNFDNGSRATYDSLNPYGSNDWTSVLLNGLLQTVFQHGLSFK